MQRKLYEAIGSRVAAMLNCQASGNSEWFEKHGDAIDELVRDHLPYGSGFDNGVTFDNVRSRGDRLVFNTAFHHMDENGMYDGWTDHSVIVTPSFIGGFDVRVTGRNHNDIKEYIAETFAQRLNETVEG